MLQEGHEGCLSLHPGGFGAELFQVLDHLRIEEELEDERVGACVRGTHFSVGKLVIEQ